MTSVNVLAAGLSQTEGRPPDRHIAFTFKLHQQAVSKCGFYTSFRFNILDTKDSIPTTFAKRIATYFALI